jgi:hypothetical protein
MQIINGILSGAPIWVWPLLIAMIFIGYKSTKDRTVSIILFYCLPFLGFITLNSIFSLPLQSVAWGAFAVGYLLGAIIAFRLQELWLVKKKDNRVSVKGEWLTMGVLMVIFWANFVGGAMQATRYDAYASIPFVAIFALFIGAASGTFLGRCIRVLTA